MKAFLQSLDEEVWQDMEIELVGNLQTYELSLIRIGKSSKGISTTLKAKSSDTNDSSNDEDSKMKSYVTRQFKKFMKNVNGKRFDKDHKQSNSSQLKNQDNGKKDAKDSEFHRISHISIAKKAWQILETTYEGMKKVKDTKLKLNEVVIGKFNLGEKMEDSKVVRKILCSLLESFHAEVTMIEESKDLDDIKVQELIGSLSTYELSLPTQRKSKSLALKTADERVKAHDSSDEDVVDKAVESGAAAAGLQVLIAAAGGAAHLPGMAAAHTTLPVIGIPVKPSVGDGTDSVLSILNMPRGVPVATVSVNNSVNAALLAARMLGVADAGIRARVEAYMRDAAAEVRGKDARLVELGPERYLADVLGKR
nr:phosphoribosylaminoimidazole carboxylase, chloroplastic-like [Quercus suber]